MKTYKLFRMKEGRLYPLFVETGREMKMGIWLEAGVGELVDPTHVKSKLGPLALRPGFHSTEVPFTDWIGKRQGGVLVQRQGTVWCECEVDGQQEHPSERYGKRERCRRIGIISGPNRVSHSPGSSRTGSRLSGCWTMRR